MVMDYSERRPVSKNRPRKQPMGLFFGLILAAVTVSFAAGTVTGWFVHAHRVRPAEQQAAPAPQPNAQPQQTASTSPVPDPPLTFYETLPKGGKAILGTGLNPVVPHQPASAQPTQQATAPAAPPAAAPAAAKVVPAKDAAKPAAPGTPGAVADAVAKSRETGRYCVQVASTQDRKEAEALKAKLEARGLPVYVVESEISGKGTWYRLRAGRNLSQQAAVELASKAGSGALVTAE